MSNNGNSSSNTDSKRLLRKLILDGKYLTDLWTKQWEWTRRQLEDWAFEVKTVLDNLPVKVRKRDLIFYIQDGSTLKISCQFKPLVVNTVAAWRVDNNGKEIERVSVGATDWTFTVNTGAANNGITEYIITISAVAGLNDGFRYKLVVDIEE